MEQIPNESEINAVTGLIMAIGSIVGLIIRSIEKNKYKRRLKRDIRDGKESLFEEHEDEI